MLESYLPFMEFAVVVVGVAGFFIYFQSLQRQMIMEHKQFLEQLRIERSNSKEEHRAIISAVKEAMEEGRQAHGRLLEAFVRMDAKGKL